MPSGTEPTTITRRAWTARMASALGLSRRRIQKLIDAGAPDATDAQVGQDWQAWERSWRQWIGASPRWRGLQRRMTRPMNLDAGHTTTMAAPAPGGDDLSSLNILEKEKVLKARADRERAQLELDQAKGVVIDRAAAKAALTAGLQVLVAALNDLPAKVAGELPADQRGPVREAVHRVVDLEKARIHRDILTEWRRTVPALIEAKA